MEFKYTDENSAKFLDEASMYFQILLMHSLNTVLKEEGIADTRTRRNICEEFISNIAYAHDAGWFMFEGKRLYPRICYGERGAPNESTIYGELVRMHVPTDKIAMHEYGASFDYFDEMDETVGDIESRGIH